MAIQIKVRGDLKELDKLIKRLALIDEFVQTEADNIIRKDRKILIDQNRAQMKETGTDGIGDNLEYQRIRKSPVRGAYTEQYAKYKEKRGGTTAYVDLYLSGKFHKSIELFQLGIGEWKFTSTDEKYNFLIENYGENILGVNDEFLDRYSDTMEDKLNIKVDKYLNV